MFTGIVQAMGKIEAIDSQAGDACIRFSCGELQTSSLAPGDSISMNGVCLTIRDINAGSITVDVSAQTLACTTLATVRQGGYINLEKALLPTTPLSGHFVSGHVDGVGVINSIVDEGRSVRMRIAIPVQLARYIAMKGSVCVDGVSLTVNRIQGLEFDVNIIPHTREVTILGEYEVGTRVNIEVDIIARYLERLLSSATEQDKPESRVNRDFLAEHGYINTQENN
jgi:riboflavin synthase